MISLLLTGAAGHVGRTFCEAARGRYRFVPADLQQPGKAVNSSDAIRADHPVGRGCQGRTGDVSEIAIRGCLVLYVWVLAILRATPNTPSRISTTSISRA